MTADEVVSPGENIVAKIEALISRAFLVVVDASSEFTLAEARMSLGRNGPGRLCVIIEEGASIPVEIQRPEILHESDLASEEGVLIPIERQRVKILRRPDLVSVEVRRFLSDLEAWLREAADELKPRLSGETQRLLRAREYRAAVISAITNFETALRKRLDVPLGGGRRFISLRALLDTADSNGLLGESGVYQVSEWLKIRNDVVHSHALVSEKTAQRIVKGVEEIMDILRG